MYIRRTKTTNNSSGESYYTYRLVRSERTGKRVRQVTLLNLGRHFAITQDDWPVLCMRIEQLLDNQQSLLEVECTKAVERMAQQCVGRLLKRHETKEDQGTSSAKEESTSSQNSATTGDLQTVALDSLQLSQPRSVGVEHAALHALSQLGLIDYLIDLGVNGVQRSAIIGNIVARMAAPGSERASWQWLQEQSGLGELLDVDFESLSHMTLYRGSDTLMHHRSKIESRLFSQIQDLFGLEQTITLYDLTNTYFEGGTESNAKAAYGRSKEKRTDCPLVTLGLTLDSSGFVQRSQTFAGNVSEGKTLEKMLDGLKAKPGTMVIMDAGIATQNNLDWLVEKGYRYLAVKRGGTRTFEEEKALSIQSAGGNTVKLYKDLNKDKSEVFLHCYSELRASKEQAMQDKAMQQFEDKLDKLRLGLSRSRTEKRLGKLQERIGRFKEQSKGISQHYSIELITDDTEKVIDLKWEKQEIEGSRATHPGTYCLRSNETDWSEEQLWRTYTMLTDLESVFRSLKSELGLRPVYHQKENRVDGHLFITVLAYQCVQTIRCQLKQAGIEGSWTQLRKILSVQQRVTVSMNRQEGGAVHIRKATVPEADLRQIYDALGVSKMPGGIKKMVS